MRGFVTRGLFAGAVAGATSGGPSTAVALGTGGDPLEAVRAAGSMVGSPTLVSGAAVHAVISLFWGVVLAAALPRRRTPVWGLAAGGLIAAFDLGLVARRFPRVRALPALPQVADHLAYGTVVGAVLSGCRSR